MLEKTLQNLTFFTLFFTMLFYWVYTAFRPGANKVHLLTNNNLVYKNRLNFLFPRLCMAISNFLLILLLLVRWEKSGHFPLSNLYESLMFLAWCCTFLYLIYCTSFTASVEKIAGSIIAPSALLMNAFATFSLPKEMQEALPLVPALQSNWLMMHVTVMIISYATLMIGCLLSILFLILALGFPLITRAKAQVLFPALGLTPWVNPWAKAQALSNINFDKKISNSSRRRSKSNNVDQTKLNLQDINKGVKSIFLSDKSLLDITIEDEPQPTSTNGKYLWPLPLPYPKYATCMQNNNYENNLEKIMLPVSILHEINKPFWLYAKDKNDFYVKTYPEGMLEERLIFCLWSSMVSMGGSTPPLKPLSSLSNYSRSYWRPKGTKTKADQNKAGLTSLILQLDSLSYRIIGLGFPFLTIGILSGAVWANEAWGSYWSWDPKETWALLTWLVFAIYLHTRLTKGWQGTKPAVIASLGFIVVWFCYLGVNLIGEGLHSYGFFKL
uniref:Cytochrome c biogenesis protein CcsA n=1 Tax=Tetrabaena socialis TaxID=47790 RepID=A0A1B1FK87_9CHLO|nr:heme attachment to plastid cytochrome c [Tetrabaena socialis]